MRFAVWIIVDTIRPCVSSRSFTCLDLDGHVNDIPLRTRHSIGVDQCPRSTFFTTNRSASTYVGKLQCKKPVKFLLIACDSTTSRDEYLTEPRESRPGEQ